MGKKILAVVLGVIVGCIVIFLVEAIGHRVHPPPADLDYRNAEQMKAYIDTMPSSAFLFVLGAYALGSCAGGWVAAKIGKAMALALIVGAILEVFGVMNVVMIPSQPLWFIAASLALYLPCSWLGGRLALRG
jgi:hypothetical protein